MPSNALQRWCTARSAELDEIEAAHRSMGGSGPGRRYATQQVNQALAMLLSSQFQGFCRDLHDECAQVIAHAVTPTALRLMVGDSLIFNRRLDRGNPTPGNIGSDFNRFDLKFMKEVQRLDSRNQSRMNRLEELNAWRNAIAHQDFDPKRLSGRTTLQLQQVRAWRQACDHLAVSFDEVMRRHIQLVLASSPW